MMSLDQYLASKRGIELAGGNGNGSGGRDRRMTVPHPLSLGESQLKVVLDRARHIPAPWRSRWLSLVADRLITIDVITDEDVRTAIRLVDEQIGVAA